MSLLEAILSSQNGGAIQKLAQNFNLEQGQAQNALANLLPALSAGLKRNSQSQDGLAGLMGALGGGRHQQYLDNPEILGQEQTRNDGNAILGHILGNKDVSRGVASQASQQTGLDAGILKKMLPVVATMAMGALSKKTQAGNSLNQQNAGGAAGLLGSLLDADGDGSVVDDVLGFAKKLF